MIWARSGVRGAAVLVLVLAGCNQNTAQTEAPVPSPAEIAQVEPAAPPPAAPEPAPVPPSTELPVNSVDSVMLSRPEDAPNSIIIRVLGTAVSGGWSLPNLEPIVEGGDASIISFQFVATSPEAVDDTHTAAEQIVAELRVDELPADIMTIRIVSATNEVSAPIAQ